MPGIFGIISKSRPITKEETSFSKEYSNNHSLIELFKNKNLFLGAFSRQQDPYSTLIHKEGNGINTILHGHCFDPNTGHKVTCEDLSRYYKNKELETKVIDLEGAFSILIQDINANKITICNDRFAIIPVYLYQDENRFCFSPNLRFLPEDVYMGEPDPTSVIHFLTIGKYPGTHTPLKNVNLLPPATILTCTIDNLLIEEKTYWIQEYKTEPNSKPTDLLNDLSRAIEATTNLYTHHDTEGFGIFLSGGWDSRSILGASLEHKHPPALAITNGKSDQIKGSDTWLAKRICHEHNIPCLFSQRNPQSGEKLWQEGLWFSEIATENSPGNFGIHRLPEKQFNGLSFMLKGDVTWGSGDLTDNEDGVINKNFPYPVGDNVLAVLSNRFRSTASDLYKHAIDRELSQCPNTHPADRQQWLWQKSGINRYIFGLGYFDEEYIQIRRPLMSKLVIDQWSRVPWQLRINKNLFIESIYRKYPDLFKYGRNHTSHLANYYAIMAPYVKQRSLNILNNGFDLNGLLDVESCKQIINRFSPSMGKEQLPGLKTQLRNKIHDKHAWRWHRSSYYKESPIKQLQTSDHSVAFRLYLMLEWFSTGRELVQRQG